MIYYYYPKDETDIKTIYAEAKKILEPEFIDDEEFFTAMGDSPVVIAFSDKTKYCCCALERNILFLRNTEKQLVVSIDELLTLLKLRLV